MKNSVCKKNIISKKAFSLIELSVVIVVLAIVVTGLLSISINAATNDKTKKSKDNIDQIYKAMGSYLLKNNRLPCPAPITSVKSTDVSYGKTLGTAGNCADVDGVYSFQNLVYGMVPIGDLGIPNQLAEDGFGNKFGYLVYQEFTDSALFGTASSNARGIDVKNNTVSLVAANELAMFAIISYGANKYGAFNANSATQNSESTLTAEKANYPTNLNNSPVSPLPNTATFSTYTTNKITLNASSANASTVFDDMVFFKTRNDMVRDFDGLFLIKCPAVLPSAGSDAVSYNAAYMSWKIGGYGQIVLSEIECPTGWKGTVKYPGRRCGEFGKWEAGGVNPGRTGIAIPCTQ